MVLHLLLNGPLAMAIEGATQLNIKDVDTMQTLLCNVFHVL